MISVVLCVYNGERYVKRAVDSYLMQTYRDKELILVDDGSLDRSGKICDQYAEEYENIYVIHTENCGLGSARKTGMEYVHGDWVVFLDADDWFEGSWLEQLAVSAKEEKIDIVIGNAIICRKHMNGEFLFEKRKAMSRDYIFESDDMEFLVANAIAARMNNHIVSNYVKALRSVGTVWDKMYRTDFLRKEQIHFQKVRLSEDLRFTSECFSKAERVKYSASVEGYYYYLHEDTLSKGKDFGYVLGNQATVEYYLSNLDLNSAIIRQAIAVSQLRFLIMDIKQYFRPKKMDGKDIQCELEEVINSSVFKTAIKPLDVDDSSITRSEKEVFWAIEKKEFCQL